MRGINLNRQLLGIEDLLFGVGIVTQIRAGKNVNITRINAGNLPFDETRTLLEWVQSINIDALGSMVEELQSIYANLTSIGNVEDNLVVINSLNTNITVLQSLYTNISKLQNIDTNISKLQNIDTNMSKLQNIDTDMSKLLAIYTDLLKLEGIYANLAMLQTIYNNLTTLNNINSQVIPNLTELLLVNDNAVQVSADKLTVSTDKGIIDGYKNDVSVMKLAVETIYDTFDDRFLGIKANDPTVDNDGNALIAGAMYFNTSSNALKVYDLDNTIWVTIPQLYLSSLLDVQLTSITTGDLLTWNGTKWVNTRTPKVDSLQLNGGTSTEGILLWNANEGTADLTLPGGSILQIGQEEVRTVRNGTALPIPDGTLVMFDGTIGNSGRVKVKPFTGGFSEAHLLYGMTTQLIAAGMDGIINIAGKVRGINTTGSLYGETWLDGDILYAKPDNAGALTKVVPADDKLKLRVATVIHSHTSGTLEIRFTPFNENMYYTKTQSDTLFIKNISSTDNAIVRFNGTTGEVQNSGIFIDDINNLGINTSNPLTRLVISNGSEENIEFSPGVLSAALNGGGIQYIHRGSPSIRPDFNYYLSIGGGAHKFFTNDMERMRIDANGNVGIGVTPSAWSGFKALQQQNTSISSNLNEQYTTSNGYYNGSNWIYNSNTGASQYLNNQGTHTWKTAPSGTADNPITWTNAMTLGASGNLLLTSATGGLGYGTGAGGVVTQLTSKSTAVTLNKPSGVIFTSNTALAAGASAIFTFNNNSIRQYDNLIISGNDTTYRVEASATGNGYCSIRITNLTGSSLSQVVGIAFQIIKGATA